MRRQSKRVLRNDLGAAQLQIRLLAERLAHLTSAEKYQAGFQDGVLVTLQQLQLWLRDSRASAEQVIATTPVDHDNPDFKQGYQVASAWIEEAIQQLDQELERRAHEQHATITDDPLRQRSPVPAEEPVAGLPPPAIGP